MSRTTKRNDKPLNKKWSRQDDKPWQYRGSGKKLKKKLNKAQRKNGKRIANGQQAKSLKSQRSDVNYRGT